MLTNALMVQGTTSDAGKSTLAAGICRALLNRGLRVCPFKPQNMALNSAVTSDGGEIGRAQALQAAACKIDTHSDMNPVLLKPTSDIGAQVIIQGRAIDAMDAQVYHDYKAVAKAAVLDSFSRLQNQFDFIVVEGAGSPAEINLRDGDIANMGFAEEVDCPVILVADIDKGGVFAHIVGTLALLSHSEQNRVLGFVINKFRGDISLLEPGLKWLEEETGKPVFGVLPYLHDLFLDAEDAIHLAQTKQQVKLRIAVPVLPHTSNHTDFDVLRSHPEIELNYISINADLPACDLLILPGSKSVRGDFDALLQRGWQEKILRHLRYGGKLIGICGGFQMLGESIADPEGIESTPGTSNGLGLIPMNTVLKKKKQLERSHTQLTLPLTSGLAEARVDAYEIHCGISEFTDSAQRPFVDQYGSRHGYLSADNQIFASYFHGLFDTAEALDVIVRWAGAKLSHTEDLNSQREKELDKLTSCIEQSLNLDALLSRIAHEETI